MRFILHFIFNVTIYVTILSSTGLSTTLNGIDFAEDLSENNVTYVLNGAAARTYMFVDVYLAGLYLTEKKKTTEEILDLSTNKVLRMHYLRDIPKNDLNKVWKHSLEKICKTDCAKFSDALSEFYEATIDVKKGTEIVYVFNQQYVEIRNPDKSYKIIKNDFDDLLLSTWIGENPPTKKLKNGLLGKK